MARGFLGSHQGSKRGSLSPAEAEGGSRAGEGVGISIGEPFGRKKYAFMGPMDFRHLLFLMQKKRKNRCSLILNPEPFYFGF